MYCLFLSVSLGGRYAAPRPFSSAPAAVGRRNLHKTPEYFDGDAYIQHNTGIADGLSGLNDALAALAEQGIQMIYDETHMILADGNFVLAVSEGTFGGVSTAYYDLWRVENGKIAEHWDVMETISDQSDWANDNGKF